MVVQNQTVSGIFVATLDFSRPYLVALEAFSQYVRLQEARQSGFINASNGAAWMPVCFSNAQVVGSLYVGYPDGSLLGYRGNTNGTALFYANASHGTYQSWVSDTAGNPVELYETQTPFDATARPWYAGAQGGFYVVGPYRYAGQSTAGLTFSAPLYEDLQVPGNLPLPLLSAPPPAAPGTAHTVKAVMGVDASLQEIATVLQSAVIATSPRTLMWYFTSTGQACVLPFAALTSPHAACRSAAGGHVRSHHCAADERRRHAADRRGSSQTFASSSIRDLTLNSWSHICSLHPFTPQLQQVPNALLNATMAWLLAQSGVAVNDYGNYARIRTFLSYQASLVGEQWIVSCQTFATKTLHWTLVTVTPYSEFYGDLVYANMVGLIIIFCCILPVMVVASGLASYFAVSLPAMELARCMSSVASEFFFCSCLAPPSLCACVQATLCSRTASEACRTSARYA